MVGGSIVAGHVTSIEHPPLIPDHSQTDHSPVCGEGQCVFYSQTPLLHR